MSPRRATVAWTVLLGAFVACESLFHVNVDGSSESTVPAATPLEVVLGEMGFGDFVEMDITQDTELANQGVEPGDISSVELTSLTLEATSPTGSDLSFIDRLELWAEAPGVDAVRVAWQDDFPVGQSVVALNLDDVDLTDHAVSQSMTLTTDVTASRPEDETTVLATYEIRVGVTKQGCTNALKRDE